MILNSQKNTWIVFYLLYMSSQYLTKTELADRWSWSLIERFYPNCDKTEPNPKNNRYAPMQLYNIHRIRLIEHSHVFRIEWEVVLKRKKALRELKMKKKRNIKS